MFSNFGFMVSNVLATLDAKLALLTLDVGNLIEQGSNTESSGAFAEIEGKVTSTGFGVYRLVGVIACIGFIIAGGWAMFKMFFIASPQEKQEAKSNMLYKVLAVVGFFAIPGIIVLLSGVGQNLFD